MTVIAIDGTFSSGKGTLGKRLAAHYSYDYLDTGKLYRAVALHVLITGGNPDSAADAAQAAQSLDLSGLDNPKLNSGNVGAAASRVAVHPEVRSALLHVQQDFAQKDAVLDGRDIGTVICPDADVKLFIDATPEERAKRRFVELISYGETTTYKTVLSQLHERDGRDSGRAFAPLKIAADAHIIDTTGLGIEEVKMRAVQIVEAVLNPNS